MSLKQKVEPYPQGSWYMEARVQPLGWARQPEESPAPSPDIHNSQGPVIGIGDHWGTVFREDHKGGTLKDVGTEEKNAMESIAPFCVWEQCASISCFAQCTR